MTDVVSTLRNAKGLDDLYPVFAKNGYTAGWHKKRRSLWPEPNTEFRPLHWRYRESSVALQMAARWISTELAERRNLLMFNPVGDNDYSTVRTLVAAYQMILPKEHARAHRHTPNALRLILDSGPDLFTVVNGVKLPMVPGDVLLTPGTAWHSHFNEGDRDACWIDFLDVPLVQLLEPMFYEEFPGDAQPITSEPADSPYWFRFDDSKDALSKIPLDAYGGRRLVLDSTAHIPTMELSYTHLPAGATTGVRRSATNSIFAAAEGSGHFTCGDQTVEWERGDILAAPIWFPFELSSSSDAYVFQVSDAPVMRMLGFHREEVVA